MEESKGISAREAASRSVVARMTRAAGVVRRAAHGGAKDYAGVDEERLGIAPHREPDYVAAFRGREERLSAGRIVQRNDHARVRK